MRKMTIPRNTRRKEKTLWGERYSTEEAAVMVEEEEEEEGEEAEEEESLPPEKSSFRQWNRTETKGRQLRLKMTDSGER